MGTAKTCGGQGCEAKQPTEAVPSKKDEKQVQQAMPPQPPVGAWEDEPLIRGTRRQQLKFPHLAKYIYVEPDGEAPEDPR